MPRRRTVRVTMPTGAYGGDAAPWDMDGLETPSQRLPSYEADVSVPTAQAAHLGKVLGYVLSLAGWMVELVAWPELHDLGLAWWQAVALPPVLGLLAGAVLWGVLSWRFIGQHREMYLPMSLRVEPPDLQNPPTVPVWHNGERVMGGPTFDDGLADFVRSLWPQREQTTPCPWGLRQWENKLLPNGLKVNRDVHRAFCDRLAGANVLLGRRGNAAGRWNPKADDLEDVLDVLGVAQ